MQFIIVGQYYKSHVHELQGVHNTQTYTNKIIQTVKYYTHQCSLINTLHKETWKYELRIHD